MKIFEFIFAMIIGAFWFPIGLFVIVCIYSYFSNKSYKGWSEHYFREDLYDDRD